MNKIEEIINILVEKIVGVSSNVDILQKSIEKDLESRKEYEKDIAITALEGTEEDNTTVYLKMYLPVELKQRTLVNEVNKLHNLSGMFFELKTGYELPTEVHNNLEKYKTLLDRTPFRVKGDKVEIYNKESYSEIEEHIKNSFKNGYIDQWRNIIKGQ